MCAAGGRPSDPRTGDTEANTTPGMLKDGVLHRRQGRSPAVQQEQAGLHGPAPEEFLAAMPKVSLHCHLLGSIRAATVVDLAAKHGVPLDGRTAEDLYDHDSYADLGEFLRVLDVVGSVVRDLDDLHRVTYESLTSGGAAHRVLYREIQISPPGHGGVPYPRLLEGITAGMRDARADTGIDSRIVVGLNREDTPAAALALVEEVIAHRTEEVAGIGLDYAEVKGPPHLFEEAFARAGAAGLRRTAHSESGPPRHIGVLLDELGCDRVDHAPLAVDELERLLSRPSWLSVHMLRMDPLLDSIRGHPRFQALLAGYSEPRAGE
jgi:adenine deaminase